MDTNTAIVLAATIAALPGILTVLVTLRIAKMQETLHVLINSGLDRTIAAVSAAAEAKGRDEQRVIGEEKAKALVDAALDDRTVG